MFMCGYGWVGVFVCVCTSLILLPWRGVKHAKRKKDEVTDH